MAVQDVSVVVPISNVDEIFNAPASNPFSPSEVDILGRSAMDCIANRVTLLWPRKPAAVHVTLQLPAEQTAPQILEEIRAAVQRYCNDKIESNQLQRKITVESSKRQFFGAIIGFVMSLMVVYLLYLNPLGILPDVLRGILIVLAFFAGAVLTFDSLWSLVFDWVPFAQDTATYQALKDMEIKVEAQAS